LAGERPGKFQVLMGMWVLFEEIHHSGHGGRIMVLGMVSSFYSALPNTFTDCVPRYPSHGSSDTK
jgi:hypothetical protein